MDAYKSDNDLFISVTNFKEFTDLAERAEKEAQQLQHTIAELKASSLKIHFNFGTKVSE